MKERDTRNQKELEEFVLVKNDKTPVFRDTDVKVKPIAMGKNGPVFEVVDKEDRRIGIVKDSKTFEFDPKYKEILKKTMGKLYDLLGFDTEELKFDVMQQVKEQEQQRMNEGQINDRNNKSLEENNEKSKENEKTDEEKEENANKPVEKEDLDDEGIKAVKVTRIKDQNINESLVSGSNIERGSVAVAKMAEGSENFKIYGKEKGTGKTVELQERPGGKNNSIEEVNVIRGNVETKESVGATKTMTDLGNMELSIKDTPDDIEVRVLSDVDESGNREAISVDTDTSKSTMEEYQRRKDEQFDKYGEPSSESILTQDEMNERVGNIRNKIVRQMVEERINETEQNFTKEQLEEIIDETETEYSIENHEPQRKREI